MGASVAWDPWEGHKSCFNNLICWETPVHPTEFEYWLWARHVGNIRFSQPNFPRLLNRDVRTFLLHHHNQKGKPKKKNMNRRMRPLLDAFYLRWLFMTFQEKIYIIIIKAGEHDRCGNAAIYFYLQSLFRSLCLCFSCSQLIWLAAGNSDDGYDFFPFRCHGHCFWRCGT